MPFGGSGELLRPPNPLTETLDPCSVTHETVADTAFWEVYLL